MYTDYILDVTDARLAGVTRRCVQSSADSALRIPWVLACMHECLRSHDNCRTSEPVVLPLRLIDLGFGFNSQLIQLLESRKLESTKVKYVALSHCWGIASRALLTTTGESLAARMNGIERGELPQTFRHAVDLCRSLGFQYLWIDSLCIVQDDNSEWASESSKMAEIYSGATLTVAASAASNSSEGLSIYQDPTSIDPYTMRSPRGAFRNFEHCHLNGSKVILQHASTSLPIAGDSLSAHWSNPLQDRAWALQERALSTRKIFCDKRQLLWECKEKRYLEGWCVESQHLTYASDSAISKFNSISIPPHSGNEAGFSIENARDEMAQTPRGVRTHDQWLKVLQEFGQRNLTFKRDALPAMSGLAKYFSLCNSDVYLASIWSNDLSHGLAWVRQWKSSGLYTRDRYKYNIKKMASSPKSIDECYAPSWSWASIHNKFESTTWRTSELSTELPVVRLESVDVAPLYSDVYGQLRRARIELSGYGCRLRARPRNLKSNHPYGQQPGLFIFELDGLEPLSLNQYLHPILDHWSWLADKLSAKKLHHKVYELWCLFLGAKGNSPHKTYELCCLLLGAEGNSPPKNGTWHCLLLYTTKEDPTIYKRCGVMIISTGRHWPMWKDLKSFWKQDKFVIV
jgi:hypothetical protein